MSLRFSSLVRTSSLALTLLLTACAQPLGGTLGDPTTVTRPRAAEPARASRVVQAFAAASGSEDAASSVAVPDDDSGPPSGKVIQVGPDGDVPTIAQAARLARSGDTVEVQAGEYRGDVAVWPQKRLTVRAVGGRAVLVADGKSAEGKGIWVIRDGHFEVEGFDFVGARVADRNGAGIRFDHGTLIVRDSRFIGNENGILTSNDGKSTLIIESSLFEGNGHGDGYSHGVYAGRIARVEVRGSWFRDGRVGHLLKTRARESVIENNRLTDERGNSSYELEFPNGGRARVVGNIIEQSEKTSNPVIVSYGAEGYKWPENELEMSRNVVVDLRSKEGVFVRVSPGDARAVLTDNLWVGEGTLKVSAELQESGNRRVPRSALRDPARGDYRPVATGSAFVADPPEVPEDWAARSRWSPERRVEDRGKSAAGMASDITRAVRSGDVVAPSAKSRRADAAPSDPRTIRVGPQGDVATIADAARLARDGDIVEVQAGVYRGDVAVWTQKRLKLRSVGGRAVLQADGRAAEGKAIWVLRGGDFEIDGFDFIGTRVPSRNGAGIRFERGKLLVRNSHFLDNQVGLMTGNDANAELVIEHCEFSGPRDGPRWYHNLDVGKIARFTMTESVSRDARVGHLLRTRARASVITGNRLDGTGTASYELEFPDGGVATVRGNVIEQGPLTENPVIVSFGAEGYRWPQNELRMSENTLVNRAGDDTIFVRVSPGNVSASLSSNIWVGPGRLQVPDASDIGKNRTVRLDAWKRTATR